MPSHDDTESVHVGNRNVCNCPCRSNPIFLSLISFDVDAAVHSLYPRSKARAYQTRSIFLVRYRHTL